MKIYKREPTSAVLWQKPVGKDAIAGVAMFTPTLLVCALSFFAFDTMMVTVIGIVLALAVTCVFCLARFFRCAPDRTNLKFSVCAILFASVLFFHAPLRLAFFVSRPSLDRIANKIESGEPFDIPRFAGVFMIVKVEDRNGMPAIWTSSTGGNKTGFGRPADGVAKDKFNHWSDYRIADNWFHIVED